MAGNPTVEEHDPISPSEEEERLLGGKLNPSFPNSGVIYTLAILNEWVGLLFCCELYRGVCRLETRENPLASLIKKIAISLGALLAFFLPALTGVAFWSSNFSVEASMRYASPANFRAPFSVLILGFMLYLVISIILALMKSMAFRRSSGAGSASNARALYLISLVVTMVFCVFLQTLLHTIDAGILWVHHDLDHLKECNELLVTKGEMPFRCLNIVHDPDMFHATACIFLQLPCLFLHVAQNLNTILRDWWRKE